MLSKLKTYLIFLSVVFLITSCQSDLERCEEIQHMGDFFLLKESKSFIPYQADHSKVIFSDSIGNEYEGLITRDYVFIGHVSSSANEPCPFDKSITLEHEYNAEKRTVQIIFEELNIVFNCCIQVNVKTEYNNSKESSDYLSVAYKDNNGSNYLTTLNVNIQNRNGFTPTFSTSVFHESFEIHGKNYTNVYSHNNNFSIQDDYHLFYSEAQGIIGLKSLTNSEFSYKFERIE